MATKDHTIIRGTSLLRVVVVFRCILEKPISVCLLFLSSLYHPMVKKGWERPETCCSFETKLGQQSINSNKLNLMALCTQGRGRSSISIEGYYRFKLSFFLKNNFFWKVDEYNFGKCTKRRF